MRKNLLLFVFVTGLLAASPALTHEILPVAPRIDVVFTLDATGSMADEIEPVKEKIRELVAEIAAGTPTPDVRFGLVAYRDRGDEYVTRVFPLTRDIDDLVASLDRIQAGGGGDGPESVNEALHVALTRSGWDTAANTAKILFLIGDAPPHLDYPQDYDFRQEARNASKSGITIHPISCSGNTADGIGIFREIASITGGEFEHLTYRREVQTADGETRVIYDKGGAAYLASAAMDDALMDGRGDVAELGKKSAPVPGRIIRQENNLSGLLIQKVKEEARKKGVRYEEDDSTKDSSDEKEEE